MKNWAIGLTNLSGLKVLILIASALTPSSPKVWPLVAYMSLQSNATPSGSFIPWLLMAAAVAAAISSSVMSVVQLMVGDISLAVRDWSDVNSLSIPWKRCSPEASFVLLDV